MASSLVNEGASPTTVGTLSAWYDAQTLGSLWQDSARTIPVAATNDPVGAWDQISPGTPGDRAVLQAGAGFRPFYIAAGYGGGPCVRFDGDDYLSTTAAWVASLFAGIDKPFFSLVAVQQSSLTGTQALTSLGRNAANGYRTLRSLAGGPQLTSSHDAGGTVSNNALTGAIVVNTPTIIGVRYDGVNAELFNGYNQIYGPAASVVSSQVTIDRFGLGALVRSTVGNFLIGDLAGAALWTTLTEPQRLDVTAYFFDRYNNV